MADIVETEVGPLPASWTVRRFDSLFAIQQGKQVSKKTRGGDNVRPFLRTKNVLWGRLDLTELDAMHFSASDVQRLALKRDDLLICEGGDIGRTAIWDGEMADCYYQNHLHRARAIDPSEVDPLFVLYWLWYAFRIGRVYFGRGNETTIPNLSKSSLGELPVPLPPTVADQRAMASVLASIDRKIDLLRDETILLTELFDALLQQLMTAQLDDSDASPHASKPEDT